MNHRYTPVTATRLNVLPNHRACLEQAAMLGAQGAVIFIDAGNRFDPYYLRERFPGLVQQGVLERILVTRPFTTYQLRELVRSLPAAIGQTDAQGVVVPCVDRLFFDSSIPTGELRAVLRQVLQRLTRTALEHRVEVSLSFVSKSMQRELYGGVAYGPNITHLHEHS